MVMKTGKSFSFRVIRYSRVHDSMDSILGTSFSVVSAAPALGEFMVAAESLMSVGETSDVAVPLKEALLTAIALNTHLEQERAAAENAHAGGHSMVLTYILHTWSWHTHAGHP